MSPHTPLSICKSQKGVWRGCLCAQFDSELAAVWWITTARCVKTYCQQKHIAESESAGVTNQQTGYQSVPVLVSCLMSTAGVDGVASIPPVVWAAILVVA